MADLSFDKLVGIFHEFEKSSGPPTISVGNLALFRSFARRMFSDEMKAFEPQLLGSPLPNSLMGVRVEEDDSLPAFAFVIEDSQEIRVFDMRSGKGVGAIKDKLPYTLKTREDRTAAVYIMLGVANGGEK